MSLKMFNAILLKLQSIWFDMNRIIVDTSISIVMKMEDYEYQLAFEKAIIEFKRGLIKVISENKRHCY